MGTTLVANVHLNKNSKYIDAYRHYLEEAKQENAQSTDFHLVSIP